MTMDSRSNSAPCVICRSRDTERIATNRSFGIDIFECKGCGFVQSEYVSDSALRDYYSQFYRKRLTDEETAALRRKSYDQAVSQVTYIRSIVPGETFINVLDFGAADGELAKLLKVISRSVYVTESDPQYQALLAKEADLTLLGGSDLESGRYRGFFDLISLSHVLEHLNDPLAALEDFSRLLRRDGFLFLDLPSELEMLTRAGFQAKGHLSYFTPRSLEHLVRVHGKFDILEIRTCNHSVEDFIASGFKLPEQYFLSETPNGTVIRTLLRNSRPEAVIHEKARDPEHYRRLADEYSRRILHLHHRAVGLENRKEGKGRPEVRLQDQSGCGPEIQMTKGDQADCVFNLISAYLALGNMKDAEKALVNYGHCLRLEDIEKLIRTIEGIRQAPEIHDRPGTAAPAVPSPSGLSGEPIGDILRIDPLRKPGGEFNHRKPGYGSIK